jgi:hypothetical protein
MQIAGDTPAAAVFPAEHSERPKFAKASRLRQHDFEAVLSQFATIAV